MHAQSLTSLDEWDRVKEGLKNELGDDIFSNWFGRVKHEGTDGGAVQLSVPTRFLKNWIQSNYEHHLVGLWKQELKDVTRVELTVRGALRPRCESKTHNRNIRQIASATKTAHIQPVSGLSGQGGSAIPCLMDANEESAAEFLKGASLNPKYTFDNFVEGSSNSLACAATRQMAVGHEGALNMLYIRSATGLGKSHLLQAAANEARRQGRRVAYLSAEYFMYHLVPALRTSAFSVLRQAMQTIDLLLVDDIQFLHGKQVREEFSKTLEMLMDAPQQVIAGSDRAPDELEMLSPNLKARIQSGEVVTIEPGDFSLRTDILKKRIRSVQRNYPGFDVPSEVVDYIARYVISSTRDLEGALNRLFAHNQLTRQPICMTLAEKTLHDLVRIGEPRSVKVEDIQQAVCKHYSVTKADLLSACRARTLVRPRQVAMYIAKVVTGRSLPEIGRRFGNRDHTTVLHAVRKIEALVKKDRVLAQEVELLKRLSQS